MPEHMGEYFFETLFSEGAAFIIMLVLLFSLFNKKGMQERMIKRLCITNMIAAAIVIVDNALLYYAPVSWFRYLTVNLSMSVYEAIPLLLVLQWLIFVDYTVYRSPDHIKRRYSQALIPIIIIFILVLINLTILASLNPEGFDAYDVWNGIMELIIYALYAVFIFKAFKIVREYHKGTNPPLFLRLDVFLLPFLLGLVLSYILKGSFLSLGFAVGIVLTWLSVRRRQRYIDRETEFYNSDFLSVMTTIASEKNYPGGSAIIFKSAGGSKVLPKLLESFRPDDAILLRLEEDTFMALSSTKWEKAVYLMQRRINEAYAEETGGMGLESGYVLREPKESIGDFAKRVEGLLRGFIEEDTI